MTTLRHDDRIVKKELEFALMNGIASGGYKSINE